jgi:NDP-sugar pyrophosphorylase family protein
MRKIKNILILAGGDSTRFWPLTNKVVFPFLGKPLINYIIDQVFSYAYKIIVVSHPNIEEQLKKNIDKKVLVISQKEIDLGMAGAVLAAKNIIRNNEALIINGSDLLDFSFLPAFIRKVEASNEIVITAKEMKDNFPGGYLKFDDSGRLIEILEKPKIPPSSFYKLVVDYFFDLNVFLEKILKLKNKIKEDCLYEQGLNFMIKESKKTAVFCYQKDFYSLKYPWHVLNLMNYFLKAIKKEYFGKNVLISKKAKIVGPVYFSKGVKVGDYAKVVGPTFVGENSVIADFALVNKSHIGKDCLIGGYSEVTRSYLGNKVFLHRNYVGDSVIADNVLMGAGAVLANFRFDGQPIRSKVLKEKITTSFLKLGAIIGERSKVGVNATILPGVKIGKKTFIGPGQIAKEDIADNKFLFDNKLKDNLL